jgi:hypothetical protein
MRVLRLGSLIVAALAIAGCSGGGGGSTASSIPPVSSGGSNTASGVPRNSAPAANAVTANVTVSIPLPSSVTASKAIASVRRPQYVTAYTKGIDLEADQNGTYSGYVFYALTPQSTYCSTTGTALVCTLSLLAPPGSDSIVVHTYDNTTVASSNILSVANTPVTIGANVVNNVTVTTAPIAASFNSTPAISNCDVVGTPLSQTLSYTAYDADGGALTGLTLGNTLTLTDANAADTSGGYTVTPSTLTSGSGTYTYAYNGTDTNPAYLQATASIGPTGAANVVIGTGFTLPVGTAGPHMIYVADSTNNDVVGFDVCNAGLANNAVTYSLPAGTNPTLIRYDRSSTGTAHNRLFVGGANNTLVWLDATTAPGTVLQTVSLSGTPQHLQDSSTSTNLWVTVGTTTLARYAINETTPALSLSQQITSLQNPLGFGLEGNGNDLLLADSVAGTILSITPGSTMPINGTVHVSGTPNKVSGPNGTPNCALATTTSPNAVLAITVGASPQTSVAQIGSAIALGGAASSVTFFPPGTPGSGTVGYGGTTGIVATPGAASIVTCTGSNFASAGTWTTFPSNPSALAPSNYASTAVSSAVYVTGTNAGMPVVEGFNQSADVPLFVTDLPANATPTEITAGP